MNRTLLYIVLSVFAVVMGCKTTKYTQKAKTETAESSKPADNPLVKVLDGLRLMSYEDRDGLEITIDGDKLPAYNEDGKKLSIPEILAAFKDDAMTYDLYADKDLTPKVAVFRPEMAKATEEDLPPMEVSLEYAPEFTKTDMSGKEVALKDLKGKVVVMNFWFTRCNPCVQEIPDLNKMVEQYKGQDVVFLGITQDKAHIVKPFLKKNPFDYQLITDAQDVMDSYIVLSYPTNIVLDKKGDIIYHSSGYRHQIYKTLGKYIDKGLKG